MIDEFLIRAGLAGLGVALTAGPLGCFVVWRRMAYFGDSLAHSALLGVALGIALGTNLNATILVVCLGFALVLVALQNKGTLSTDTALGILSHTALALGILAISMIAWLRVDLMGYLFGDILSVGWGDVVWIYAGAALCLSALAWIWPGLLRTTIHEDLARAEGVPSARLRLIFMMLMAVTVAIAMQVVGILLITALLIIPPAAARPFARSPESMAGGAVFIGALSVIAGLGASLLWDSPTGPSIVLAAAVLFLVSLVGAALVSHA